MTFAFASLAVIAVAIFVLWPRGPTLRVLDPRMRVISARLLTGTNVPFYAGNPLEGRARDFLKRIGLPVESLPDVGRHSDQFMGPTEPCRFAIYFKWTGASDPGIVTAELVELSPSTRKAEAPELNAPGDAGAPQFVITDQSGNIHTVPTSLAKFQPMKDYYLCVAELNPELMNQGNFLLRFLNPLMQPVTVSTMTISGDGSEWSKQMGHSDSSNIESPSNYLAEIVIKRIPLNQNRR
jgi:hypothetical protein